MKLSTITIARDEADFIGGCLEALKFADESIVVIDDRSSDDTESLARAAGAKVFRHHFLNFSEAKNFAREQAGGQWVLDIDADERVSSTLANEITAAIESTIYIGYELPFDNYFFAHKMRYGGWEEIHLRLYQKAAAHYSGDIHEQLIFSEAHPKIGRLQGHIAHFSHRDITHNLYKTINYINIQAQEMYDAGHPPVGKRTFIRVVASKFWSQTIWHRGYKDGTVGWIEGLYQPFSWFCIYVRLWELQQHPSLKDQYRQLEKDI